MLSGDVETLPVVCENVLEKVETELELAWLETSDDSVEELDRTDELDEGPRIIIT